jgi:hypothetical protein
MISDVSGIGSQQSLPNTDDLAREAYAERFEYSKDGNIFNAALGIISKYRIIDGKIHREIVDEVRRLKKADDDAELLRGRDRALLEQLREVSWIHRWEWLQEQKDSSYAEAPTAEPEPSTKSQEQLTLF